MATEDDAKEKQKQKNFFAVGTAFVYANESEPKKGAIYLFEVSQGKLSLVAKHVVKGAVYSLLSFNGFLLASVNNRVAIYKLSESEEEQRPYSLEVEADYCDNILALYLASRGHFILVGDLMRSMNLLVHKPAPPLSSSSSSSGGGEGKLEELARDYRPNWMTAVEMLDDDHFLGAENSYNLFTLRKETEASSDYDRRRLDTVGLFHLGDFVNRFRPGSLVMKQQHEGEDKGLATMLFGAISGSIGVVASLGEEDFSFYERLQDQLRLVIRGVGGFEHSEWRKFHNERKMEKSKGFIDGDLIESFLDLKRDKMEQVATPLGISVDDLCKKIETLSHQLH